MNMSLKVVAGHYSSKGKKAVNQDRYSFYCPEPALMSTKGVLATIADGISSSQVSQFASDLAVNQFRDEYLRTSCVWSPARAGRRVLETINLQLLAKTQHSQYLDNFDLGYVCTFAGLIIKGGRVYLFNCGDSSIFHIRDGSIQNCTKLHRAVDELGNGYLSNALGIRSNLQLDVTELNVVSGDTFILATDGIVEFTSGEAMLHILQHCDSEQQLQQACEEIADVALANGCDDNVTLQVVKVKQSREGTLERYTNTGFLPFIENIDVGSVIDNWQIIRNIHHNDRSSLFEVKNIHSGINAVMKVPSYSMQEQESYLDELAKEEWLMAKVSHVGVVKKQEDNNERQFFYTLTDFIDGITMRQWLNDHGPVDLRQARIWLIQLVSALGGLHSKGILHQDLRPENIMVDKEGNLKLIDLGSASLHGQQFTPSSEMIHVPGDMLYSAPEYFLGYWPDTRSDMFSLAVLIYHTLSGDYPYNTSVAKLCSPRELSRLKYKSLIQRNLNIPVWVDATISKACRPDMQKRYQALSEFSFDMHNPNPAYNRSLPLMERNPVRAWQLISLGLAFALVYSLAN